MVKIDGVPVDPKWTVEDLHEALYGGKKTCADGRVINRKVRNLTFRNEVWNQEQTDALYAASNKPIATSIGGIKQSQEQCVNDSETQPDHSHTKPLRPRTTSADRVGKALNGFGNFFQNLNQNHHHHHQNRHISNENVDSVGAVPKKINNESGDVSMTAIDEKEVHATHQKNALDLKQKVLSNIQDRRLTNKRREMPILYDIYKLITNLAIY